MAERPGSHGGLRRSGVTLPTRASGVIESSGTDAANRVADMAHADEATNRAGQPLTVDIFWRAGGGATVAPAGELDLLTVPLVAEALFCVRMYGSGSVELDGRHLAFCDVCGLGALINGYQQLAEAGRCLHVTRPNHQLRRLIEVAHADYLLQRQPLAAA